MKTLLRCGIVRGGQRGGATLATAGSGQVQDREEEGYRFGRWHLLPQARQLLADGRPVPLGSRAFDLLVALVEAQGALLSKDALLDRIWPGIVVEENNLQVQVSALRKALGEDAATLVQTVPGRGYRFAVAESSQPAAQPAAVPEAAPTSYEGPPLLVVLPFANMTGDPGQDYLADGMTEDMTMALSQYRWFSVIARNSAFTYRGRAVDVREIGRQLGVRYVLEGSVRRAASRLRVAAQLSEAESGRQVWAERIDGEFADIFDMQDQVTEAVAGAVEPSLQQAEIRRARTRPTGSLGAYDLYLRALPLYDAVTTEANAEAWRLLRRALAIDPEFAAAQGELAIVAVQRFYQGWAELAELEPAVQLAWQLLDGSGDIDPHALVRAAHAVTFLARDYEAGVAGADRALRLAPNSALVLYLSGWNRLYVGDWETASARIERAMRLSPVDPGMFYFTTALAAAQFVGERYEESVAWSRRAIRDRPRYLVAQRLLAAALAQAGREEDARATIPGLLAAAPGYTVAAAAQHSAFRGETRARYLDGLRRAGLPE